MRKQNTIENIKILIQTRMHEFDLQVKLLKACGIVQYPSEKMNIFYKFLIIWDIFITIYCTISAVVLVYYFDDLFQVFEIIAIILAAVVVTIKHVLFYWNKEEFFIVIDDIRMLNEKCK